MRAFIIGKSSGKWFTLFYPATILLIIVGMCLPWLLKGVGFNIYRYADAGDVSHIRSYLHRHPDHVDQPGFLYFMWNFEGPYTPLIWAARGRHLEAASELIKAGADPNIRLSNGMCALYFAIGQKDGETMKVLLEHGADPNADTTFGDSVLSVALRTGDVKIATILLEGGADPNRKITTVSGNGMVNKRTPMDDALNLEEPKRSLMIDVLLKHGFKD